MKKYLLPLILFASLTACKHTEKQTKTDYTLLQIENSSKEDSVLVYLTIQAPNSVVGMFGISAGDTIGSCSKGSFYAYKDSIYSSNDTNALLGAVISFGGDNLPCQVAITQGFLSGINIFECSINTPSECFDISCEDGVNSIIKVSVNDSNWTTGDGDFIEPFFSAANTYPIQNNIGIRGVFPYRCTDCKDTGTAVPQNCFNLKDTCNASRICQTARTNQNGGTILVQYMGKAFEICK